MLGLTSHFLQCALSYVKEQKLGFLELDNLSWYISKLAITMQLCLRFLRAMLHKWLIFSSVFLLHFELKPAR